MIINTTNIWNFLADNWAAVLTAGLGAFAYFNPTLATAVKNNPHATLGIGLASILAAFYANSVGTPTPTPVVPAPVVPPPSPAPTPGSTTPPSTTTQPPLAGVSSVPVILIPVPAVPVVDIPATVVPVAVGPVLAVSAPSVSVTHYAKSAGFAGADLLTAVEIAYAESAGMPQAIGDSDTSFGLWQINLPAHPQYTKAEMLDPQMNANAAFTLYTAAGNHFTDWTTFKNGAYKAQVKIATADGALSA